MNTKKKLLPSHITYNQFVNSVATETKNQATAKVRSVNKTKQKKKNRIYLFLYPGNSALHFINSKINP